MRSMRRRDQDHQKVVLRPRPPSSTTTLPVEKNVCRINCFWRIHEDTETVVLVIPHTESFLSPGDRPDCARGAPRRADSCHSKSSLPCINGYLDRIHKRSL